MREYRYDRAYDTLLTPDIVSLIAVIHEHKGEQTLLIDTKSEKLTPLIESAWIQSTEASNKLAHIDSSGDHLKKIVRDKTAPKTRSEKELAGYHDVFATIRENFDFIPPRPSEILQLHHDLYKFSAKKMNRMVGDAPEAMNRLCAAYEDACKNADFDPLLLIPMFILDFLCIHPFQDGNGRMSRLLTLLLLYRAGYIVGKYISIENEIAQTEAAYNEALRLSSAGWKEGANNYVPFVRYMLGVVATASRAFSASMQHLMTAGISKAERVREQIKSTPGRITKTELMQKCPDISQVTVQRALSELVKRGEILKISGGRYTSYAWNRENSGDE